MLTCLFCYRVAAFLSRQRNCEESETMEMY
jgi:hypothetical protein